MLSKPKLVLFSPELPNCNCYNRIFNTAFESHPADTVANFLAGIQTFKADAAVFVAVPRQREA